MKILIVDDDATTLKLLTRSIKKWGYSVSKAANGKEALEQLNDSKFDMIVSDWLMPEIDGLELCHKVRSLDLKHYIYMILISGQDTRTDIVRGLEAGVDDFITKPLNLDELRARLGIGARIIQLERELNQKYLAIKRNYYQSIHMFTQLLETYDAALGSHSRRVGRLCLEIARRHQDIIPEDYPIIEAAGLLHDIGLIGLPNTLVVKSMPEMTGDEKELYHQHPERGEGILNQVDLLRPVAALVRLHHEQPNGRGFPDGVSAAHIPAQASIVSAASIYDDMVYHRKWSFNEITEKLQQMRGYQLPLEMVELLLEINLENKATEAKRTHRQVEIDDLEPGMVLASDIHMKTGAFVMAAETVVCESVIEKLQRYYDLGNISDKVLITK
jgi:response regulator RpfG family c-di-GMP phosphodiesterase